MLTNSLTIIVMLLSFAMVSIELECEGAKANSFPFAVYCAHSREYKDNDCKSINNEYSTTNYYGRQSELCSPYANGDTTTILCLCTTDLCNTDQKMQELLTRITMMSYIPRNSSGIVALDPTSDRAKQSFLCMKQELGLNAVIDDQEVVVQEVSKTSAVLQYAVVIIAITILQSFVISLPFGLNEIHNKA